MGRRAGGGGSGCAGQGSRAGAGIFLVICCWRMAGLLSGIRSGALTSHSSSMRRQATGVVGLEAGMASSLRRTCASTCGTTRDTWSCDRVEAARPEPRRAAAGGRPARRAGRRARAAGPVLRHQPRPVHGVGRPPLRAAGQPVLADAAPVRLHPAAVRPVRAGPAARPGLGITNVVDGRRRPRPSSAGPSCAGGAAAGASCDGGGRRTWPCWVSRRTARLRPAEGRGRATAGAIGRTASGCCRTRAGSMLTSTRPGWPRCSRTCSRGDQRLRR